MMYERICKHCGKPFLSYTRNKVLCSEKCNSEIRRRCAQQRIYKAKVASTGKAPEKIMVKIKITEPIDVFDSMRPGIGTMHTAEKIQSNYATMQNYIIPGIGKYGLLIRENECEEVGA